MTQLQRASGYLCGYVYGCSPENRLLFPGVVTQLHMVTQEPTGQLCLFSFQQLAKPNRQCWV